MMIARLNIINFLVPFLCASGIHAGTLPAELLEVATKHECGPIDDFFDRPGMVDPPFLYGYLAEKPRKHSAMFWCRSKQDRSRYRLIAHAFHEADRDCSGVVVDTTDYPGGLSLSKASSEELHGYMRINGAAASLELDEKTTVILSMYDGVGISLLCHDGQWFRKQWD